MKKVKKYNEFLDTNVYIDIKKLIEEVNFECGNISDLNKIYSNSKYQKIIECGEKSIKFIFDDFKTMWIKALEDITNEKLYDDYSITTSEMKEIWKNWAIENGYK